jgi:hypothetical protein
MGFGLVIGFIGFLKLVIPSNCSAVATLQFTTARTKCSQSAVSLPIVAWEHFQSRRSLSFRVSRLRSSRAAACLTTRLSIATQRLTVMGAPPSLTHPPGATVCDGLRRVCLPAANC